LSVGAHFPIRLIDQRLRVAKAGRLKFMYSTSQSVSRLLYVVHHNVQQVSLFYDGYTLPVIFGSKRYIPRSSLLVLRWGIFHSSYGVLLLNFFQLGSCGFVSTNADHIVALSTQEYNEGMHCDKMIQVHHKGRVLDVKVVDKCPSCSRYNIDLSTSAFLGLAPTLDLGLLNVTWRYL